MTGPSTPAEHADDGSLFFCGMVIALAVSAPISTVIILALWRLL